MAMIDRQMARRIVKRFDIVKAFAEGKTIEWKLCDWKGKLIRWEKVNDSFHLEYLDSSFRIRPADKLELINGVKQVVTLNGVKKFISSHNRHEFEKIEIFLKVKGRLPNKKDDKFTQKILNQYCEKYESGKLVEGIVPLKYMYDLIKNGDIKL